MSPAIIENSGLIQNCGSISLSVSGNVPVADQDTDTDASCDGLDCAPADASSWSAPSDVRALRLAHSGGAFGVTDLSWALPAAPGGDTVFYDVLSSGDAAGFDSAVDAICLETGDGADTAATDPLTPWSGEVSYFVVRAGNACGRGPAGHASDGAPRVVRDCP